eukprot:28657-Pelagococcus_subviridis.AAC.3
MSSATRFAPFAIPSNDFVSALHPGACTRTESPPRRFRFFSRHARSCGVPPRPWIRTYRCVGPSGCCAFSASARTANERVRRRTPAARGDPGACVASV